MYIVILITAKDQDEGQRISTGLLEDKLVACCNIIPKVQSFFWWDNKIDASEEVLLVIKTKKDLWEKVQNKVKQLHSYQTPEIIALPIVEGSLEYLNWIKDSVI
ncbi:MAG: divalent-cation tolerance protein CutA [Candidatus Omnitrophica bacterium]|nr:divalent-cation tolerance protein CutA [Candidatus Omnitrophota bacterium]MCB9747617.1 divalent-cation tolerance protein CutA [Candidatus Omnitrophota bacterium]